MGRPTSFAPAGRRSGSTGIGATTVTITAALLLALAGCTAAEVPDATSGPTATGSTTSSPSPTPTVIPTMVPGGTAEQNLPYFDHINRSQLAAKADSTGRDFVDALVAAGFVKTDMQVTDDETSIGLDADSIQFSVKIGDRCLVGQNGQKSAGYHSVVVAPIATGSCLIGATVPIDW